MTTLYNLRHSTDNNFTITKFVDGEVESSYELAANLRECACPAGHRPSCRHRQMAPMMLASGIIDTHYFWDYDLNRAVDFNGTLKSNFDAMNELADRAIGATIEDFEREHGIEAQHTEPLSIEPPTPTIDSVPSCGQENGWEREMQYGRAYIKAHSKPTRLNPTVAKGPPSEVEQIPPGDYTAEVGKIKTFDDGVVMMQMKNIKPWRRL